MDGSFYREEDKKESVPRMPDPLYRKVLGSVVTGVFLVIAFVVLSIAYRNTVHPASLLPGVILGLYVLGSGLLIRRKWVSGQIEEHIYRCISCKRVLPFSITVFTRASDRRNNCYYDLVCTETEEDSEATPHLYEFRIGRGGEQVTVGGLVILYVDTKSPRSPVAWKAL